MWLAHSLSRSFFAKPYDTKAQVESLCDQIKSIAAQLVSSEKTYLNLPLRNRLSVLSHSLVDYLSGPDAVLAEQSLIGRGLVEFLSESIQKQPLSSDSFLLSTYVDILNSCKAPPDDNGVPSTHAEDTSIGEISADSDSSDAYEVGEAHETSISNILGSVLSFKQGEASQGALLEGTTVTPGSVWGTRSQQKAIISSLCYGNSSEELSYGQTKLCHCICHRLSSFPTLWEAIGSQDPVSVPTAAGHRAHTRIHVSSTENVTSMNQIAAGLLSVVHKSGTTGHLAREAWLAMILSGISVLQSQEQSLSLRVAASFFQAVHASDFAELVAASLGALYSELPSVIPADDSLEIFDQISKYESLFNDEYSLLTSNTYMPLLAAVDLAAFAHKLSQITRNLVKSSDTEQPGHEALSLVVEIGAVVLSAVNDIFLSNILTVTIVEASLNAHASMPLLTFLSSLLEVLPGNSGLVNTLFHFLLLDESLNPFSQATMWTSAVSVGPAPRLSPRHVRKTSSQRTLRASATDQSTDVFMPRPLFTQSPVVDLDDDKSGDDSFFSDPRPPQAQSTPRKGHKASRSIDYKTKAPTHRRQRSSLSYRSSNAGFKEKETDQHASGGSGERRHWHHANSTRFTIKDLIALVVEEGSLDHFVAAMLFLNTLVEKHSSWALAVLDAVPLAPANPRLSLADIEARVAVVKGLRDASFSSSMELAAYVDSARGIVLRKAVDSWLFEFLKDNATASSRELQEQATLFTQTYIPHDPLFAEEAHDIFISRALNPIIQLNPNHALDIKVSPVVRNLLACFAHFLFNAPEKNLQLTRVLVTMASDPKTSLVGWYVSSQSSLPSVIDIVGQIVDAIPGLQIEDLEELLKQHKESLIVTDSLSDAITSDIQQLPDVSKSAETSIDIDGPDALEFFHSHRERIQDKQVSPSAQMLRIWEPFKPYMRIQPDESISVSLSVFLYNVILLDEFAKESLGIFRARYQFRCFPS